MADNVLSNGINQPGKPESISSSSCSITIQWSPPRSIPDKFQNYEVKYKEKDSTVRKWNSSYSTNDCCKLELKDLKENTVYQCKVRTIYDNDEEGPFSEINDNISTTEKQITKQNQPTHLSVLYVTSNSTTIEWEKPSDIDNVDYYDIKFKDIDTQAKEWMSCLTERDETNKKIENLSEKTCYNFKVRAIVKGEDGPFSETIKIRTAEKQNTKPGPLEKLYVTDKEISLQWEKPTENYDNISHYEVRYRQTNVQQKWIPIMTGSSENKITVQNLREKTEYEFILRAIYNETPGPFSDPICIATNSVNTQSKPNNNLSMPIQDTPGKPTNIHTTSNSITIQWSAPEKLTSAVDCYEVRYKECNPSIKKWQSVWTDKEETKKTLTELTENCAYEIRVRAIIDDNESPLSSSNIIYTKERTADVPGTPEVVSANHYSLSLKWKKPGLKSKAIRHYEVQFKMTDSTENCTRLTNGAIEGILLENLNDNTTYEIKVRAVFDDTNGPFSKPLITTTKSSTINVIKCLPPIVETVSENNVTLQIKKPLQNSEEIDLYEIHYQKVGSEETNLAAMHYTESTITINDLEGDADYEFKVCAVVKGYRHLFSSPVLVKTSNIAIDKAYPPAINFITSDSIGLTLTIPKTTDKLYAFEVRYKECDMKISKWKSAVMKEEFDHITVSGLNPDTEYMFQVRPMYENKSVAFSEPAVIERTKGLSNEPGVPEAVKSTDSTVTIKWKPPDIATSIDFYDIRYRNEHKKKWQMTNSKTTSVTIGDLQNETTYEFMVRAVYGETDGKFSHICKIQTKKQDKYLLAKMTPGKPKITDTKADRIAITWQIPKKQNPDCYEVSYREDSINNWQDKIVTNNMDSISGLKMDTTYIFKIRARYGDGIGPYSELSSARTLGLNSVEHQPGMPEIKLISFDSISIAWKAPANLEKLQHYEAWYQLLNSDNWVTKVSNNTEAVLLNLQSSAEYECKARAIYELGEGPFSKAIKMSTKPKPRKQPGKPEAIKTSSSSITIRWNSSSFDKTTVLYHEIKYQECGGKWITIQSDTNQCEMTFPKLKSIASYVFMVRTVLISSEASSWSPTSEPITTKACFIDDITMAGQSHDSMVVSWKPPEYDGDVKHYVVDYREVKSQSWNSVATKSIESKITINNLKASTQYEVRIKVVHSNSEGEYSMIKNGFSTSARPLAKTPGTPTEVDTTSKSITLTWNQCELSSFECYEIRYRESSTSGKWLSVSTEIKLGTFTVPDLKGGTDYEFKVAAVVDGEASKFSNISKTISTKPSVARTIQLFPEALINKGPPERYKLPVRVTTCDDIAKTRKCVLDLAPAEQTGRYDKVKACLKYACKKMTSILPGSKKSPPRNVNIKEKTIMLVGATGSGKSTMIDGMINYITDISWEDDFRFSLIDITQDEKKNCDDETKSQTEWITTYKIPEFPGGVLSYTLNIIDTPGFGDTRGIEKDKNIVSQVDRLFQDKGENGIQMIDAVCFVEQSPQARLTPTQKYIFDSILSIFGKDISSNIFVLITFADGKTPPVLDALHKSNFPFNASFKFNNSALFEPNNEVSKDKFAKCFWKMGEESFKLFFSGLDSVETKSLQLTKEVLRTRMTLEVTIEGLQKQVTVGMNQLNTIRQESEILKRHKTDIEANKNFDYKVEEVSIIEVKLQPGEYVTNCLKCNLSCHFPCRIAEDENKQKCKAMDGKENCSVCPEKCHWAQHRNAPFRLEAVKREVSKTYEELKQKYEIAKKEANSQTSVLRQIKKAFISLKKEVYDKINKVRKCINDLEQFALKPNPLSDIDYIDLLIRSEETESKYGWQDRVKLLINFRKEAEVIQKVTKSNKYTPFDKEDEILKEYGITEDDLF